MSPASAHASVISGVIRSVAEVGLADEAAPDYGEILENGAAGLYASEEERGLMVPVESLVEIDGDPSGTRGMVARSLAARMIEEGSVRSVECG